MPPDGPRRELRWAALFVALWVLVPFWKIATLRAVNVQDDIFASDLWNDRLPARAFVGSSLRRGESPAWNPGIYTGFPSLAQIEVGTLYPSNVALFGLLPPYVAMAWAQILPLVIGGVGSFALARAFDLPTAAALLSSGTFALSGFLIAHLRQLNMVDAAAWLPLLLLAVERIAAGRPGRAPLALAVLWAIELLAGHPQIAYYAALVLLVHFVVRSAQLRTAAPIRRAAAARLLAALALGTLIAAVQLLPAAELARLTDRGAGLGAAEASRFPVSPLAVWTLFVPRLFGDAATDDFRLSGLSWEQYAYVGLLPLLLAVVAVVVRRNDGRVRWLAALAAASYLLALGASTPLFGWAFRVVPGMDYFRFPSRFLLFVDLALALLAGFGLAACLESVSGRRRPALAAALLAVTAADLWMNQMRQVPQAEWARWLAPIDTERFLARAREREPGPWRYYTLDAALVHGQVFHGARGWSGDLTPYVRLRALLQPSFNLLFGLDSPDGYSNLVPRRYEMVWGSEKKPGILGTGHLQTGELEPELARMLRLFNVRYLLSVAPLRSPALRPAAESADGVRIYELVDPLPRAFVVGELLRAADDAEALRRLTAPDFDPARQAVVVGDAPEPSADAAPSRDVRFVSRSNTSVALRARLERPGWLVLSEGHYPGWRVTVDGADAPLLRVNLMMRGVRLGAGAHEVVFRFRSPAVRAGALVSLLALAALVVLRRRLVVTPGGASSR
ncbi:MAG: YfhO family protein [Deltaproteobacteria bacterium]|nr:YfhO family protein [Deltaproteobacteria bacterium]